MKKNASPPAQGDLLPDAPTPPLRYSVREAAAMLGLSVNSVYSHCRAGHLKHVRFGAKIFILADTIREVLKTGMPMLPSRYPEKRAADEAAAAAAAAQAKAQGAEEDPLA